MSEEALIRRIRKLEAQLALQDLENADLRGTISDLDGRNPNPEFRALRDKLEAAHAAGAAADQKIEALETQIEVLRFDLDASRGEVEATREELVAETRRAAELEVQASRVRTPVARDTEGAASSPS